MSLSRLLQTKLVTRSVRLLIPSLMAVTILLVVQHLHFLLVSNDQFPDRLLAKSQGEGQLLPVKVVVETRQLRRMRQPAPEVPRNRGHAKAVPDPTTLEMAVRQATVAESCSWGIGNVSADAVTKHGFHIPTRELYVCLVAKIASTFWARFLYQLVHTAPIRSPFDISAEMAYRALEQIKAKPHLNFNRCKTRMIFVREPYGRLFSAFIDKLLSPNPVFWKAWGQKAVAKYRPDMPVGKANCGHDVSFSEFVRFTVDTGFKYDYHLQPIYRVCLPCSMNFTVIGKMETFLNDAKHVMSRLDIPEEQMEFERMQSDLEEDALSDATGGTFSTRWLNDTLKCVSRHVVATRVWRKLQIRGFISWRQKLRLTDEQKTSLGIEGITTLLQEARAKSTNKTELKIQKKQAFMEAYRTLAEDTVHQIIAVYGPDFHLFGYDVGYLQNLEEKFPNFRHTHALDTSKDWDLSPVL